MELCPKCGCDQILVNDDMLFTCLQCGFIEEVPPAWMLSPAVAVGATATVVAPERAMAVMRGARTQKSKPSRLFAPSLAIHMGNAASTSALAGRERPLQRWRLALFWLAVFAAYGSIIGGGVLAVFYYFV